MDELTDYVCDRFGKNQVVLIGHSYGTMLGSKYALTHPEKVKGDDTNEMETAYKTYLKDGSLMNMLDLRSKVSPYHQPEIKTNTIRLGVASPYMGINDMRWFLKQVGNIEDYLELNRHLHGYVMEGCGHSPQYDLPEEFGAVVTTMPEEYL